MIGIQKMQKFELSNLERLMIKRKIKHKKTIRTLVIILIVVIISLCGVLGIALYKNGGKLPPKQLNVKTLKSPEYVDVQLINVGFARTGVKLVEINNIVIHYTGN